jgi:DNA-directed RNA polymerase subunit RPC12/RpoP
MALLHCRDCGAEFSSDTRQTQCKHCGALFPCACAVCGKALRPPFPVFSDERYLTVADEPLCPEHFQRQCPECNQWFQADQNPGYFLCRACTATHANRSVSTASPSGPTTRTDRSLAEAWRDERTKATLWLRSVWRLAAIGLGVMVILLLIMLWLYFRH